LRLFFPDEDKDSPSWTLFGCFHHPRKSCLHFSSLLIPRLVPCACILPHLKIRRRNLFPPMPFARHTPSPWGRSRGAYRNTSRGWSVAPAPFSALATVCSNAMVRPATKSKTIMGRLSLSIPHATFFRQRIAPQPGFHIPPYLCPLNIFPPFPTGELVLHS